MANEDKTAWVRDIKKETYMSAIGTTSFRMVASAYVEMNNVKIIKLLAKSGTSPKKPDILNENYGVKSVAGSSSDFIVNYKLEKDEDLDDINPFDVASLAEILDLMDDNLPEFYDKKARISYTSDLPISLLEIEIDDPKFVDIAKLESSKLDIRFITHKAENDDLKKDILEVHKKHGLTYLFVHGFKKHTLNCCMVIETLKRFSGKEDPKNAIIYWGGKDDLFPKTEYNLWVYIHNHYIMPREFAIKKRLILAGEDTLSLDGYSWG